MDWAGGEVGSAAGSVARSGVDALSAWAASGAAWIIQQALAAAASTSNPAVTAPWFSQAYARMWLVAGMLGALCATLGLAQAAIRGDGRMLARVFASLPVGAVVTGGAAALTSILLRATDELSAWLLVGSGGGSRALRRRAVGGAGGAADARRRCWRSWSGIVGALVALMVWVELLIRGALVYVLLGFLPLVSAVVIWPAAGGAMRKLLRLLLVTILSKLVIAGVLALGLASLTAAGEGGVGAGVEQVLAGVAMLALAAISPLTAYRLLAVLRGARSAARRHLRGQGRARWQARLRLSRCLAAPGALLAWRVRRRARTWARCRSWAAPDERRPRGAARGLRTAGDRGPRGRAAATATDRRLASVPVWPCWSRASCRPLLHRWRSFPASRCSCSRSRASGASSRSIVHSRRPASWCVGCAGASRAALMNAATWFANHPRPRVALDGWARRARGAGCASSVTRLNAAASACCSMTRSVRPQECWWRARTPRRS